MIFRSEKHQKSQKKYRRQIISRRQGGAIRDDEKSVEEILGLSRPQEAIGNTKLAAQVSAVAVLDMIKSLQEEIKVSEIFMKHLHTFRYVSFTGYK